MPKEKKYNIVKAIRVNEDLLVKKPPNQNFSTWIKDMIQAWNEADSDIFKQAFKELYSIFDEFSKKPTLEKATELFRAADLQLIDQAKEALISE